MKQTFTTVITGSQNPKTKYRNGEESRLYFRSIRFYNVNGKYFFSTREGLEIGPYASKELAESALDCYIQSKQTQQKVSIFPSKILVLQVTLDAWSICYSIIHGYISVDLWNN